MKRAALIPVTLAVALAACGGQSGADRGKDPERRSNLDAAAIEAGILPDARKMSLAGAFERDSDLGTDKFCAVGDDENGYHVGILVMFGPGTYCEALGKAEREGENVRITLTGDDECRFTADFDGIELRLPGALPKGCDSYCGRRASLAGTSFVLAGEGDAVARSTQGIAFRPLCEE